MISIGIFKPVKIPVVFAVLGMLVFGFACAGLASHASMHSGMNTDVMASTVNQQKYCNTTISKYLGSLKENILVLPPGVRDILVLLVFDLIFVLVFANSLSQQVLTNRETAALHFYIRETPHVALFNYLRFAFSQGILNPKIY